MVDDPNDLHLFREAVDLAIRLQDDPANPALAEAVRSWVARSSGHHDAWAKVAAIHGMTGTLLAGRTHDRAVLSRRQLVIGGLAGIGAVMAGSAQIPRMILKARADYLSGWADLRPIRLADGSTVVLGPDSAVAMGSDGARRDIDLLQGMAYFDVSADALRPFSIRAGQARLSGQGGGFDVSLDADFVSVSVGHGQVRVQAGPTAGTLTAGEWLTLAPDSALAARGRRDPSQIASWRQGMLIVEEETVSALVSRIARWHSGPVLVADHGLGRRVVSGVFDLGDTTAALRAAVHPFGGRVRQMGPFLTVISRA